MTNRANPNIFLVLRQVDRDSWCVVRRLLRGGKTFFASRVTIARPYKVARAIAVDTAKAEGLHLAIETNSTGLRRFDPQRDMQEPRT